MAMYDRIGRKAPGSNVRIPTHFATSEDEDHMTIDARLEQWKERGTLSPEQHALLAGLSRGRRVSTTLRHSGTEIREYFRLSCGVY